MKSRALVVGPSPDAQMQQDLEDMRTELLHEIQDGDEAEDERVEIVSFQIARTQRRAVRGARGHEMLPDAHS
jgi:hypothetical protein